MNTEIKANNYEPKANDVLSLYRLAHRTFMRQNKNIELIAHTIKSIVQKNDDGSYNVILKNGKMCNISNDEHNTQIGIIPEYCSYPYHDSQFTRLYEVVSVNGESLKKLWHKK